MIEIDVEMTPRFKPLEGRSQKIFGRYYEKVRTGLGTCTSTGFKFLWCYFDFIEPFLVYEAFHRKTSRVAEPCHFEAAPEPPFFSRLRLLLTCYMHWSAGVASDQQ